MSPPLGSASARVFPAEFQSCERPHRRRHQPAEVLVDECFHVLGIDMRMAAGVIESLANREHLVDGGCDGRMVVLSGMAEVLRKIALADEHHPDASNLLQDLWQVLDDAGLLAHD